MDEAVAGFANRIELELAPGELVTVRDNGRGIPVDKHPKHKTKSALEVILTTLHSGGKFGGKAYATSGGLHGVGISVVNALSDSLTVEVARDRNLWRQNYSRGTPLGPLEDAGAVQEPTRHHGDVPSRPGHLRGQGALQARPALPHGASQGLSVPRRRDPLGLRSQPDSRRRQDPGRGDPALPRRAVRLSVGGAGRPRDRHPHPVCRARLAERRFGAHGMGRGLAEGRRGIPELLLQHRADPAGRNPRTGLPRRH